MMMRSISRNVASLNILIHDLINLFYYEHWTDKRNYFYVYQWTSYRYLILTCKKISFGYKSSKMFHALQSSNMYQEIQDVTYFNNHRKPSLKIQKKLPYSHRKQLWLRIVVKFCFQYQVKLCRLTDVNCPWNHQKTKTFLMIWGKWR